LRAFTRLKINRSTVLKSSDFLILKNRDLNQKNYLRFRPERKNTTFPNL